MKLTLCSGNFLRSCLHRTKRDSVLHVVNSWARRFFQTFQLKVIMDYSTHCSPTHSSFSFDLTSCSVSLQGILLAQYKIVYGINVLWCMHLTWSSAAWLAIHTGRSPYLAKQHIKTIFISSFLKELFD